MSAGIVLSCDGHRHGQPCRGFLPTRALSPIEARLGEGADWRSVQVADAAPLTEVRFIDLCPSRHHDEDETP